MACSFPLVGPAIRPVRVYRPVAGSTVKVGSRDLGAIGRSPYLLSRPRSATGRPALLLFSGVLLLSLDCLGITCLSHPLRLSKRATRGAKTATLSSVGRCNRRCAQVRR